ncbi:C2 family cysteine protease [Methylosinus sp. LW4]|uniref:C2 family cysteine protease n=1 Tax=Methylosinus sp. LW4 TaxID=136993 RepID=UPI00037C127A|nr:C2 family cysteine protease [Methylosinus sp. LW4]
MAHHKDGLLTIPASAQIVACGNPSTPAWNDFHHRTFKDLFPSPPSAYDVRQGGIGDCWLLSALISILELPNGPDLIERSMKDVGLGSVVVRLYKGGVPHYVKISKSVVSGLGAHSFVWVKLIEKAAAALHGSSSYENLGKGGVNADKAFGMLLGAQATAILNNADVDDVAFLNTKGEACLMACFANSKPDIKAKIETMVFEDDATLFNHWTNWWTQTRFGNWYANDYSLHRQYKYEHFEEFLKKSGLHAGTRDQILSWAAKNSILPGKRSSGVYSRKQLEVFYAIRNLCLPKGDPSKRDPIVAETKPFGKSIMTKNLGTAGEGIASMGLVRDHCYAVLGVEETHEHGVDLCWIKLHNPHNMNGVKYERGVHASGLKAGKRYLRPVPCAQPRFVLELGDFTKNFETVTHGSTKLIVGEE